MIAPAKQGASATFACFGTAVTIEVFGDDAPELVREGANQAIDLHHRLSRFETESDLCRLNEDPRRRVPASEPLIALARSVRLAGTLSGGLVDATCLPEVEAAGYTESLERLTKPTKGISIRRARPALPDPKKHWMAVEVDDERDEIIRPPGVRIDSGGLGKGLAADLIADRIAPNADSFLIDCGGDIRIGGSSPSGLRRVTISHPDRSAPPVSVVRLSDCGVATSGTTRRRWDSGGRDAHHLIDPGRGRPAETGIVQATALATTALEAEIAAKSALLAGAARCSEHLPMGGWIVLSDGSVREVA